MRGRYRARIMEKGHTLLLGQWPTRDMAAEAYDRMACCIGVCHDAWHSHLPVRSLFVETITTTCGLQECQLCRRLRASLLHSLHGLMITQVLPWTSACCCALVSILHQSRQKLPILGSDGLRSEPCLIEPSVDALPCTLTAGWCRSCSQHPP